MDWLNGLMLPQYCETGRYSALTEPFNTASSAAFFIVTLLAYRSWRQHGKGDAKTFSVVFLCFLIGLGSMVFHVTRTPLALFIDVAPSALFILTVFGLILIRLFDQSILFTLAHISGLVSLAAMATLILTPPAIGHGAWLVVPLVALYVIGSMLVLQGRLGLHEAEQLSGAAASRANSVNFRRIRMGYSLIQTGLVMGLAMVVRAYDKALCDIFPMGLHFLWHLLIAVAALILTLATIRHLGAEDNPQGAPVRHA